MICCAVFGHAEPVTIEFRADRASASVGESVKWTVWGELPEDAPPDAYFVGLSADIVPNDRYVGQAQYAEPATLPQYGMVRLHGAGLIGVNVLQPGHAPRPSIRRVPLFSFIIRIADQSTPIWFDFVGRVRVATVSGRGNADDHVRDNGRSVSSAFPVRVVTDIVNHAGCSDADLAAPYGTLNAADMLAFIELFLAGSPIADLTQPFGVIDFTDLSRYFESHAAGCWPEHQPPHQL